MSSTPPFWWTYIVKVAILLVLWIDVEFFKWAMYGGFDRWLDRHLVYWNTHREEIKDPLLLWLLDA